MSNIFWSHKITEHWTIERTECWSGTFNYGQTELGKATAEYHDGEIWINTCKLNSNIEGQKLGQEIAARTR